MTKESSNEMLLNREKEIFVLEEKINKIKSIFKNEKMLQLTDMINEVEDVVREKNNEHFSYESDSKSKDKLVKDLRRKVNGSKIISYAINNLFHRANNTIERLKRLNKQNEKYVDKINDLFYRANLIQDEAENLVDEINDVV